VIRKKVHSTGLLEEGPPGLGAQGGHTPSPQGRAYGSASVSIRGQCVGQVAAWHHSVIACGEEEKSGLGPVWGPRRGPRRRASATNFNYIQIQILLLFKPILSFQTISEIYPDRHCDQREWQQRFEHMAEQRQPRK
jgi:hypothetical protein